VSHFRAFTVVSLLAALAACADQPTEPPTQPEPKPAPLPLGVFEITMTAANGDDPLAFRSSTAIPVSGPDMAMNPINDALIQLEAVTSTNFTEGARGAGGQRFLTVTYRIKNNTGGPLSNLTFIPVTAGNTIAQSPFTNVLLFNQTAASAALANRFAPTGAVFVGEDTRLRSQFPDVLQVFTEAEVAAIPLPVGVTGIFPYGFVTRNPNSAVSRTIPTAANPNDWGGLVTFAYRYPLQASASADPFIITFRVLVVQDTETRMTESFEERQDTAGVRRARERATALGATTVTVLAGSPAADPFVTDYPGQRSICLVRTAGTAAAPVKYITTDTAAYTELTIYRPGQTRNGCSPYYISGSPTPANFNMQYFVTLRAMDRYGNILNAAVDTVGLASTDGTAVLPVSGALNNGERTTPVTYTTYGNSTLTATGRRLRGNTPVFMNGMVRTWDGDVNTNWFTTGDWVQNMYPGVQDSVVIPGDRPFYPVLAQNITTYGLTMTPGTTTQPFVNLSSFDLTVAGDVALGTTGTFTGTGRLILTGTSNTVGGGLSNFDVRNMRVTESGRYSASSNLNVTGGRIVVQGGRLRSQGYRIRVRPN
jgi:hypothetical protein